ncbi:hypothetical protein OEA41_007986 [Lepraria neglecta]|uniref:TPR-like protein n=1 Tax=Lepraria neglecta TaxID=209136 RepID=A0AAD9ZEX9_9LECA|nr:hypothetical protein OEA41_007986 [Lepraria neglecta]
MNNLELQDVTKSSLSRAILGHDHTVPRIDAISLESCSGEWTRYISQRVDIFSEDPSRSPQTSREVFLLGITAFNAFLQANVTGPTLSWDSAIIFPKEVEKGTAVEKIRKQLISSLSVDGDAIYQLTPHIELFCLAQCLLNDRSLGRNTEQILARLRVNFWHQKLLTEVSPTLQQNVYNDLLLLEQRILGERVDSEIISPAEFLVERATIHIHHGFDAKARDDLTAAARERSFHFALTGRLGKRTQYQEKELSQLVVLAKSADQQQKSSHQNGDIHQSGNFHQSEDLYTGRDVPKSTARNSAASKPQALDLNDDTLLESIAFTKDTTLSRGTQADDSLPESLLSLDPGNQPQLEPLDGIILLATASSITNTSPTDGLTREETLPYAERVLSGGSSNWQIYTQALLVRSRIEGYRTRTIERGVLQLQALVDQVISETTPAIDSSSSATQQTSSGINSTTFLPQPTQSESAPVSERLRYIHALASPPRWKLEAELADRWVSLGGLRTALEIYERLQMWAEVALCWAANDREDKARRIIRRQLYNPVIMTSTAKLLQDDEDTDVGEYRIERDPLPADAPRLFCILGDIEKSATAYERAWTVSNHRYARAQRSLGNFYMAAGHLDQADDAYAKSLKVNPQNHPIWFALGCVRLQLEDWVGAVYAFGRAVQIDGEDAESWSNLAVALLKSPPDVSASNPNGTTNDKNLERASDGTLLDEDDKVQQRPGVEPQRHVREAFVALKRAATLKRDSFRIWQNLLSVGVQIAPPPYADIIVAQTRLIDLLGKTEGERCVDVDIVEALVSHLIIITPSTPAESTQDDRDPAETADSNEEPTSKRVGLERMIIDLVQKRITPLITSSRRLWLLTAKLSLHLRHPAATLSAYEKAWRVTLNKPGWDSGAGTESAKRTWSEVLEATIELADAYESLGERTNESGMGAGELVAKDWKFKARSALRSVISRAKEGWEDDAGYESLSERLQELKNA